ncbi:MAG: VIT1/CCC1 transporter family protein [Egibacteraceae bacterium]
MTEDSTASRPTRADLERFRENRQNELNSAALYDAMAAGEQDDRLAEVYRRLGDTELRHANFWEERMRGAGATVTGTDPDRRTRLLIRLARRWGPQVVLPTIAAAEVRDQHCYDDQPEAAGSSLPADERSHARVLSTLVGDGGLEGGAVARFEGRHRAIGGNALRAAVLGANDGLVSNLALVMGVAGVALNEQAIVITGFAGLLAGSFSMAMGEWISVQSSRELSERQLRIEADELEAFPEEEAEELRLIYEAKGLPSDEARRVADRLLGDGGGALDVMAREELGIDPDDLGGSAWEAAFFSFLLFAMGAIVPVLPFLLLNDAVAVATSVAASGIGLFLLGAAITLFTGRRPSRSGLRQMVFGLAAAALTYGIGALLGVSLT